MLIGHEKRKFPINQRQIAYTCKFRSLLVLMIQKKHTHSTAIWQGQVLTKFFVFADVFGTRKTKLLISALGDHHH